MGVGLFSQSDRLKGRENYATWKIADRATLEVHGLWAYVDGTAEETDATKRADGESKAKARLTLMVDPINYGHLQDASTAKEIWENMDKAFNDSGLSRRVGLLRTLINTKMDCCSSMEQFVKTIIVTAHKLKSTGMTVDDEWIGTLLLAGLGDDYKPMIMAIESSGTKISSDFVKTKLLQEVGNDLSQVTSTAMYSRGNKKASNFKSVKCFECGKAGHFARRCPSKNKTKDSSLFCFTAKHSESNEWYIDSGASSHMTNTKDWMVDERESSLNDVMVADNNRLKVEAVGSVKLTLDRGKKEPMNADVNDVLFVPNLCANLLSVSQLVKRGNRIEFDPDGCKLYRSDGELIGTADLVDNMYKLKQRRSHSFLSKSDEQDLWHRRFGHVGQKKLSVLCSGNVVNGFGLRKVDNTQCETCLQGKQTRLPFPDSKTKTSSILELIHSDVCGPMRANSFGGSRYFLTFVDDFSRKVFIYTMANKSEVFSKFKAFKTLCETQTQKKIKTLRTDNGCEYVNKQFDNYLREAGIVHQTTIPYTPEQNGKSERMNRTLVEKATCMIIDGKLSTRFWAEAINTAAYLVNRLPCGDSNKSPEELWSSKRPDVDNLRVFGCSAMVHIPKQKRAKFEPKSFKCVFVGYAENKKGYRLFNPTNNEVFTARDVVFMEEKSSEVKRSTNFSDNQFYCFVEDKIEVEDDGKSSDI